VCCVVLDAAVLAIQLLAVFSKCMYKEDVRNDAQVRKIVPESSNDGKTSDAGFGAQTMWMHNPFFNNDGNARERGLVCVCVFVVS
jgi:hypothetical protein